MDWDKATDELGQPVSEINAFLDFAHCLRDELHHTVAGRQDGDDPPDYWLTVDGQTVGVEVTTLRACQDVFDANARVQKMLDALRSRTEDVQVPGDTSVSLVFEPATCKSVPDLSKSGTLMRQLMDCVRAFVRSDLPTGGIGFNGATFWLMRRPGGNKRIHVEDQGFYQTRDSGDWSRDISEAIALKIEKYVLPPCTPCWLLLNLKPYLQDSSAIMEFLTDTAPFPLPPETQRVFDRVYAVTSYPGNVTGLEPPRVRRLL